MVVLFGLTSRPGLPCLRAAVSAYLFQMSRHFQPFVCRHPREGDPVTRAFAIFNAAISEDPEMLTQIDAVFFQLCGSRDHGNAPGIEE